jgi:hypothetical protein
VKGFKTAKTETVTLNRANGDSLTFEIEAAPPLYQKWLNSQFPKPTRFVNGKEVPDPTKAPLWDDWTVYLLMWKSLESSGVLDTPQPASLKTPRDFEQWAIAIGEELKAANLTQGEVMHLGHQVQLLNYTLGDVTDAGKS